MKRMRKKEREREREKNRERERKKTCTGQSKNLCCNLCIWCTRHFFVDSLLTATWSTNWHSIFEMYAFWEAKHRGQMVSELRAKNKGKMVDNRLTLERAKGGQPINSQSCMHIYIHIKRKNRERLRETERVEYPQMWFWPQEPLRGTSPSALLCQPGPPSPGESQKEQGARGGMGRMGTEGLWLEGRVLQSPCWEEEWPSQAHLGPDTHLEVLERDLFMPWPNFSLRERQRWDVSSVCCECLCSCQGGRKIGKVPIEAA